MAFLEDLMDCDQGFERLDFVGEDWLPGSELAMLSSLVRSWWDRY